MHSLALAQSVLDASLAEAAAHNSKRVAGIYVTVTGHFDEVDSLLFCLGALSKGTIAEGAFFDVRLENTEKDCNPAGEEGRPHHHNGSVGEGKLRVTLDLE